MSRYRLRHATRRTAGCVAILAASVLLQAPAAHAAEAVISNCLHGFGSGYSFNDNQGYSADYGSDSGRTYSRSFSDTSPQGGFFRRRFGGGFRRFDHDARTGRGGGFGRFDERARDGNGGGSSSGSEAASVNGYGGGTSSAYGSGSRGGYGADSCVEIRREIGNPYVISIQPPQGEEAYRDFLDHDRLWRDRCHPVVKQDTRGIARYVYSAPGCDYGRYE